MQTEIINLETNIVNNISTYDNQIFPLLDIPYDHSIQLKAWIKNSIDFQKLCYSDNFPTYDANLNSNATNNIDNNNAKVTIL